jgi:hypothetical protein
MSRSTVGTALVVGSTFFSPGAIAVSPAVRSACANYFLAYCSQHDPDSRAARACMRAHARCQRRKLHDASGEKSDLNLLGIVDFLRHKASGVHEYSTSPCPMRLVNAI